MTNKKFKLAGSSNMSPIENTDRKEIRIKSEAARIARIAFLDGDNDSTAHNVQQFVNLNRSESFVDGSVVPNLDRLGNKPRLKVSFSKPGAHQFTVRCVPDAANSSYSDGERARNPRFNYQREQKSYTTEDNGSLILPLDDFFVSPAGKDKFVFKATDNGGQTVSTGSLETQRVIYCVELKMRSLTPCAKNLSAADLEFAKHNIKLVKCPEIEMDYIPNIGRNDNSLFLNKAYAAYNVSKAVEKQPYSIAIVYTGHLALKNENFRVLEYSVSVGPGCAPALIEISGPTATSDSEYFCLWQGLDNGSWFVSARFIKDGGTKADVVNIPKEKCTAVPVTPESLKAYKVSIDVSSLPPSTGTIELIVNTVDSMRAGLAYSEINLICVCTKAWWQPVDELDQAQIIIHELGHKIGMVPDGRGKRPDKPATWYDNTKGHVGNHCFNGLPPDLERYDGDFNQGQPKCVMYGATCNRTEFCPHCAPVVRKVDISEGWEPL